MVKEYLHNRYAKKLPQCPPIRIPYINRNDLIKMFASFGFTKGAEIGVAEGCFSEFMCQTIPNLSLISVDCWKPYEDNMRSMVMGKEEADRRYNDAKKRLTPYGVKIINDFSVDASKQIKDESLDFVYIDAGHDFDNAMLDLIYWTKKVRNGGVIAGHDYYHFRWAGVVEAVNAYTYSHGINEWYITGDKRCSFFWAKE